jgi:hypothetical protein
LINNRICLSQIKNIATKATEAQFWFLHFSVSMCNLWQSIKILSAISRILFLLQVRCNKGHHLSCCNITATILLPTLPYVHQGIPQTSRSLPFREQRYMWHYSIQSLPIYTITCTNCEPLPHIFTLTLLAYGGYFLWHFFLLCALLRQACLSADRLSMTHNSWPLTSVLPCAVRTFLPA